MKKIFTFFAAALTALSMSAASYGILVNGKTYFAGTQVDEYEGFQQYLAHVPVKNRMTSTIMRWVGSMR